MSEEAKMSMKDEHPDYPGLTREEVERAKEKARKKIDAEQRAAAIEKITEEEEIAIRNAMGQTERSLREVENLPPSEREMVTLTLTLPPQMNVIRLDGVQYFDRNTYTVARAKAMEMLRIQFEGWRHESIRKGEDSYSFYAQQAAAQRPHVVINSRSGIISGAVPRGTH